MQAFFNAVSDGSFVRVIDCLTSGIGFSINEADCTFPTDLETDEGPFDGVRFSLFEDAVVIPLSQLRQYIKTVCDDYVVKHPEDKHLLDQFLTRCQ
jgi:hypothetical protein